jgi:hypothetical protein
MCRTQALLYARIEPPGKQHDQDNHTELQKQTGRLCVREKIDQETRRIIRINH